MKKKDDFELSTICRQIKLESSYGEKYETDWANTEGRTCPPSQVCSGVVGGRKFVIVADSKKWSDELSRSVGIPSPAGRNEIRYRGRESER